MQGNRIISTLIFDQTEIEEIITKKELYSLSQKLFKRNTVQMKPKKLYPEKLIGLKYQNSGNRD